MAGCAFFCAYDCYQDPPPKAPPASRTIVTVIPAASDGHIGTVVADVGGRREVLNTAYATVRIGGDGGQESYTSTAEEVEKLFGRTLASRPLPPVSLTAYFDTGTDQFSEASVGILDRLQAELARRGSSDIAVIGHTDRVGTDESNDRLSEIRAWRMRDQLIKLGIAPSLISVEVRGEREPLVDTADGVPEPINRRVEINIR